MSKDNLAYDKAIELYKEKKYFEAFPELQYLADAKDHLNSIVLVANMYNSGSGTTKDPQKAVYYYTKAANRGNVTAKFNLALMYELGVNFEKDYYKALELYKDIITKHPKAVEKVKALYELFKNQVAKEETEGYLNIGMMLNLGVITKQNNEQALQYFKKAASKDNARALRAIASMYYNGEGVEQSYEKAIAFYNKAAIQRDAPSLYAVGLMYIKGYGVEKSLENALKYFKHAAVQNYAPACYAIALMFGNIEKNQDTVLSNLTKAADQNHIAATYALALMYHNRIADTNKAIEYYTKAADLGHLKSILFLAQLYDEGVYVTKNISTSCSWYIKAANLNDENAKNILTDLKYSEYI